MDALSSVNFRFRHTPVKPSESTSQVEKKSRATNMKSHCVLDGEEDENPAIPGISRKEKKNRKEIKKEFLQKQQQGEAALEREAALEKEAEQAEIDEDRDELNVQQNDNTNPDEQPASKKAKI